MNTDNITKKFRLAAILPVGLSALLAKVLAVLRSLGSSDVMITGSDSAFVKMLPSVCGYASVLFGVAAVAFCMTGAIYAMMYFGRKTAVRASLLSIAASAAASALYYAFNMLYNSYSLAQGIAFALTTLIDIGFVAISAFGALAVTSVLKAAKKRAFSIGLPIVICSFVYFAARIADLTFSNVVPFLSSVTDITASEKLAVIGDYVYYTGVYLILLGALCFAASALFVGVTGRLKFKLPRSPEDNTK